VRYCVTQQYYVAGARGVTAFVLKYRLAHAGGDARQEFAALYAEKQKFGEIVSKVVPLSVADGLAAVMYVRKQASEWGINVDRVGTIRFSAGGSVTRTAPLPGRRARVCCADSRRGRHA
jgi:hypothetical protein